MGPLPTPRIDHLSRLTDDMGIFEHASGLEPDRSHGYTAEDAARALIVTVRWRPQTEQTGRLTRIYLGFLDAAIGEGEPLRNRLSNDRRWAGPTSADAHGRAAWGLCVAAGYGATRWIREKALMCLERLPALDDPSLRPWVYAGLGAAALLDVVPNHEIARRLAGEVTMRLPELGHPPWIWPEPRLRYDNARIAECYLAVGLANGRADLVDIGMQLLTWLVSVELQGDRFSFTPVGGRGPGDPSPVFDQQPLEATAMLDACALAWAITGEVRWLEHAHTAARWFLGLNDAGTAIYDAETGAGHDGLGEAGVSANSGAESTISALWALQRWQHLDKRDKLGQPSKMGPAQADS